MKHLVTALLAATLATAPGCGSLSKPTPVVVAETAQRSVLVAYETHAATSRALLAALATGAVSEAKAGELYAHMVAAKQAIDAAARLSALGQAAAAQADLRTAEVLLRVVAEALR